ncbi:MAG TPA: TetR family transcriptional regulator [Trebonia sp.]|nr:TetR family transcriptional regulator [Trebonia sp.]
MTAVSTSLPETGPPAAPAPPVSPGPPEPPEPPVSLRERKKLATRRLLRRAALELVSERGLTNVTVEDIAEAADVSPRTFFNYFPSKEAALFGGYDERAAALRERVATLLPGRPAIDVLRTVMAEDAEETAGELRSLGGNPADWIRRMKMARTDPLVRAAHAGQMARLERALTEGLAARLDADPETDPYPGVLAAATVGVVRSCMTFWAGSGGSVQLGQLIDQAVQALGAGLPENSDLRRITRDVPPAHITADRKVN